MKKVLKCTDFILLRLIPTIFLLFLLYSDIRNSLQSFNIIGNYGSFLLFLENFSIIMCFVFLGITAVLRAFKKTVKGSILCRYGACVMALIYITLYICEEIQVVRFQLCFSNYFLLFTIQKAMYIIGLLIVIVNCFLNNKFYKTKWILTIVCALSIFVAFFCSPLYTLIKYNDTVNLRFLLNSFLYSYSYCAVILSGLSPSKTE